jgi:hypothetical protein
MPFESKTSPDPAEMLDCFDANKLLDRLEELEAECKALRVLLRAVRVRDRKQRVGRPGRECTQ